MEAMPGGPEVDLSFSLLIRSLEALFPPSCPGRMPWAELDEVEKQSLASLLAAPGGSRGSPSAPSHV